MQTLVIDTSYGSTVGVVGHEPIVETDSRTHVEKLQVNIAQAVEQAGEWRRSDAADDPSDVRRLQSGLFDGLRDVHLQFPDMAARLRFVDGFLTVHAYRRTIRGGHQRRPHVR